MVTQKNKYGDVQALRAFIKEKAKLKNDCEDICNGDIILLLLFKWFVHETNRKIHLYMLFHCKYY